MATKAETFRYWTERSGPKKTKSAPRARRPGEAAEPGASATERQARPPRRESARAGNKAAYALEVTDGRPSRKSTRKGANRQRTDAQMRVKLRIAEVRPAPRGAGP